MCLVPHTTCKNIATMYWYDVLNELLGYSPEGLILNVLSGLY
jgi:hypothetical protein